MLKFTKLKHKDVKTSDFGKEITIRVNAESIKHYARKMKLLKKIEEMKLSDDDTIAYNVAAGFIAICTNPLTGDYTFHEDQIKDMVDNIGVDLLTELSFANFELNPANFSSEAADSTMSSKKKST